jgi:hypothetical protein
MFLFIFYVELFAFFELSHDQNCSNSSVAGHLNIPNMKQDHLIVSNIGGHSWLVRSFSVRLMGDY